MSEKIVVGPITSGLQNNVTPFNIDNDSFITLLNAYQWRGRVKRKRGTELLGRLQRFLGTTDGSGNLTVTILPTPITAGIITVTIGTDIFVDQGGASPVTMITNSLGSAVLNRSTGVLTILGSQSTTNVFYNPSLPVMGLEDLVLEVNQFPKTLAFDTEYSYNIQPTNPYGIYDVSFYKNPAADPVNLPSYVPKSTWTPTSWNGNDYQQFWTVNYQGALWATNGINIPFSPTNVGMQYKAITTVNNITGGPPAIADLTIASHGLVVGDFVFVNEVATTTGINLQTGYVTAVVSANKVTVEFPNATIANNGTGGIAQYLTNRSDTTKDSLRWYDGDPTTGNPNVPAFQQGKGWVNFAPPLSSILGFSISDSPLALYYIVGARMIIPFKDRLLFVGPVIQTSAAGSQIYLQDTIIYSQNGTAYYTASFTGDPVLATTVFHPILVPSNQTATATAYWENITGFGGFVQVGIDQPITSIAPNQDVLILGLRTVESKLVYTGNDLVPFQFYTINSELGSTSTFSTIIMDEGILSRGDRGIIITSETKAARIDLRIPDEVFQIRLTNNGTERFTAQRDYVNEWVYFTYPVNDINYNYPSQTLLYNYRDNSWGIFRENYTTYGQFRRQTGITWATLPPTLTWATWNTPWNAGNSTLLQPEIIAGNQQGFVLFRQNDDTEEDSSLSIQNISGNTITSPNHCLNNGDYITISGVQGTLSSQLNGNVFSVFGATTSTFMLNPSITSGTYLGGGLITRMYVPFIQSKQFPVSWGIARKTRIGVQQYLLTTTDIGQISLLIYLSQDGDNAYNSGPIVPQVNSTNNSLIYSTVLYTCPESTNLGLTPANINLQMVTGIAQEQIWHRVNTSLLGDTVQVAFTMNDAQMRDPTILNQFSEIELHAMILNVSPSMLLS